MSKILRSIILLGSLTSLCFGQEKTMQHAILIGKTFPTIAAETLAGNKMSYPDSIMGKTTLISIAFVREAQSQIDSWANPFETRFQGREDIRYYEIPMLSGKWKLMSFFIDGGMRSGIPKGKHNNVSTYYGDLRPYLTALNIQDTDLAYLFLLDDQGKIQWHDQGFASEEKLQQLYHTCEKLISLDKN